MYRNYLDWFQISFTKVVWKKHPSLSFWYVPIQTSWSWKAPNFAANLLEGRQAAEFIQDHLPGRYDVPLSPVETTSSRVSSMAEAAAHTACDGVGV